MNKESPGAGTTRALRLRQTSSASHPWALDFGDTEPVLFESIKMARDWATQKGHEIDEELPTTADEYQALRQRCRLAGEPTALEAPGGQELFDLLRFRIAASPFRLNELGQAVAAVPGRGFSLGDLTPAETTRMNWSFICNVLVECQTKLQANGSRQTWIEPAIAIARQEASVRAVQQPEASPPDWKSVAEALYGAVDSLSTQVQQMKGLFPDDDGQIQEALEEADEATATYLSAKRPPAKPAPRAKSASLGM